MEIIDDQGRLFGLINVIDALVVLIIGLVVVAGVTFVSQPQPQQGPAEPIEYETVTAILDLGTPPEFVVNRISEGDTYSPAENSDLTISDVYVAPQADAVRVLLAVELQAPVINGTLSYDGAPLRLNRRLSIQTADYQIRGRIRDVGEGLDKRRTRVLVSQTVDASTANDIEAGESMNLAGHEVATVESVDVFPTENPNRRHVFLGISLHTINLGAGAQFGETPIRRDRTVPILRDDYRIIGKFQHDGDELNRQRMLILVSQTVDASTSNDVKIGDTLTLGGREVASVESVSVFPTQDPNRHRVYLGLSIRTVDFGHGPQFGPTAIQRDSNLTFRMGDYEIEGEIERVGSSKIPGTPATRNVTLVLINDHPEAGRSLLPGFHVHPEIARSLHPGLTETLAGNTYARVTAVEIQPASTDVGEHPFLNRVTLTAELTIRETPTGPVFKGQRLQLGRTVVLNLKIITIEAIVVDIED